MVWSMVVVVGLIEVEGEDKLELFSYEFALNICRHGQLEYADEVTLSRALEGRQEI